MTFEILLKGHSAKNAATQNLAKWIAAPSKEALEHFLWENNFNENRIAEPRDLGHDPDEGVDIFVDEDGVVLFGDCSSWPDEIEAVAREDYNFHVLHPDKYDRSTGG